MFYQVKTVNGQKTKIPLSGPVPTGNPIGTIISTYKKIQPKNYLYCDGSFFDETLYPALYLYLGSNQLPDYRECVQVGAEQNTTDTIANHDVYTQGQFKDDQLQYHNHALLNQNSSAGSQSGYTVNSAGTGFYGNAYTGTTGNYGAAGRSGSTTHGKQKAVYYYIKAVDGVDISDEDTFLNTVKDYVDNHIKRKVYTYTGAVTANQEIVLDTHNWNEQDIYSISIIYNTTADNIDANAVAYITTGTNRLILRPASTSASSYYRIIVTYTGPEVA